MESPNFKPTFFQSIFIKLFKILNSTIPWYNLPGFIGAINLDFLRIDLRNYNLHDGYASADAQGKVGEQPPVEERFIGTRNSDGKDNSLEMRRMGCAGMRFGRNFNRKYCPKPTDEELLTPNPRLVSQAFMARKTHEFKPATTLNLLAAAWIQFQVHDWFNHEDDDTTFDIPLSPEDDWQGKRMSLFKTKADMELHPSDQLCPGYRNVNTAWWDGSQIYGSSEVVTGELRSKNQDGDRFIAGSWNADMYTKEGFQWVQDTNMSDVLCRHFPELGQVIPKKTNIFAPWTTKLQSKDRGL
ncbi:heme peroxidase [Hortaea werneckii]|nr:heme peroxidase [Hortaea werneckii]